MLLLALAAWLLELPASNGAEEKYRSPGECAWLDPKTVVVSDPSCGCAYILDALAGKTTREVKLNGEPSGIVTSGRLFYVAETGAGTVAEIGADGEVKRRFNTGPRPVGLAVAAKTRRLVVAENGLGCVAVLDLSNGSTLAKIAVSGLPYAVAVTPDEKTAATVSRLPVGDARRDNHAAVLSLLNLATMTTIAQVNLLPGTGNVTGLAISPDGKWLYIAHALGRFMLPPTQLERGWVNVNALTFFDLTGNTLYGTVLLDDLMRGAADPWGIALAPDGQTAWISLAGTHELVRVDLKAVHMLLSKLDVEQRAALSGDLAAMHIAKSLTRIQMPGAGPRGVSISPDGATVASTLYFAGRLALADAKTSTVRSVSVGAQPVESEARRGERFFHDATLCYQHWMSCATCHPDARADGFNWDLINDGIGNPKNAKSMVWADRTPPMMSTGIREDMPHAGRAGFRFILFREPAPGESEAVMAYLRTLSPAPSPFLVDGKLSDKAARGEKVFKRAGCAECHPAPLFTDLKLYDVGTSHELDRQVKQFDTPTLVEMWRTAPYLHDGSAVTIEALLTKHNPKDEHGKTSDLSKEDLAGLVEYVMSLGSTDSATAVKSQGH
jgi:DNA-binding beta-propeller fold protein YncE